MARRSLALRLSVALNVLLVVAGLVFLGRRLARDPPLPEKHWRAERLDVLEALPRHRGGLVLLGDSLVERGEWSELLSAVEVRPIKNRGVAGDRVADVIARLDGVLALEPDALVLLVGTNDVEARTPVATIAARYDELLGRVRERAPSSRVLVVGIPPVRASLAAASLDNGAIAALDRELALIARAKGATFVDVMPVLSDPGGQLDARFTLDGVHLTGAGYAALADALRAALSTPAPAPNVPASGAPAP